MVFVLLEILRFLASCLFTTHAVLFAVNLAEHTVMPRDHGSFAIVNFAVVPSATKGAQT